MDETGGLAAFLRTVSEMIQRIISVGGEEEFHVFGPDPVIEPRLAVFLEFQVKIFGIDQRFHGSGAADVLAVEPEPFFRGFGFRPVGFLRIAVGAVGNRRKGDRTRRHLFLLDVKLIFAAALQRGFPDGVDEPFQTFLFFRCFHQFFRLVDQFLELGDPLRRTEFPVHIAVPQPGRPPRADAASAGSQRLFRILIPFLRGESRRPGGILDDLVELFHGRTGGTVIPVERFVDDLIGIQRRIIRQFRDHIRLKIILRHFAFGEDPFDARFDEFFHVFRGFPRVEQRECLVAAEMRSGIVPRTVDIEPESQGRLFRLHGFSPFMQVFQIPAVDAGMPPGVVDQTQFR